LSIFGRAARYPYARGFMNSKRQHQSGCSQAPWRLQEVRTRWHQLHCTEEIEELDYVLLWPSALVEHAARVHFGPSLLVDVLQFFQRILLHGLNKCDRWEGLGSNWQC
jgi:hypothetical protein